MNAAAFFDVDGTIVAGNVVRYYVDLRTQHMSPWQRRFWIAVFALRVPWYWVLDRRDRAQFQRALYREYRWFVPTDLRDRATAYAALQLAPRVFPAAVARMRQHREAGARVVLVSGSLRLLVEPLAARLPVSDVLAADLAIENGAFSGELTRAPVAGEDKARAIDDYIETNGLDRAHCHTYADSLDDVPMLRRAGHAHVVNPGSRLERVAQQNSWEVLRWQSNTASQVLLAESE